MSDSNYEDKYAPTTWGSSNGAAGYEEITVPSGQLVLVQKLNIQVLIKSGLLQNFDSLSSTIANKHLGATNDDVEDTIYDILKDPKKAESLFYTIDRVTCMTVVQPEITMAPNDYTLREPGKIYTDTIDLDDKLFIFNYALSGTKQANSFRGGSGAGVGSVANGESLPHPAQFNI